MQDGHGGDAAGESGGAGGAGGESGGGRGGGGTGGAGDGAGGSGDELVASFARWAADQRAGMAAANRARERSLRDQAAATATWVGVLVDLAEQVAPVTVVVAGQRRSGRLIGVGRDFCVLRGERGRTALISVLEISQLWPDMRALEGPPAGDRRPSIDLPLISALALLADERAPVGLISGGGLETVGELVAAGDDVLTVRTAPPGRRLVYVPLRSVAVCELR